MVGLICVCVVLIYPEIDNKKLLGYILKKQSSV